MKKCAVYINGESLDINPAGISFRVPTRTANYHLIDQGDVEELKGINLEQIELNGILHSPTMGRDDNDVYAAQDIIDRWCGYAKQSQPIRFIYIGQNWDINMLCSIQSPQWKEIGGCFDIEYTITLHRWRPIKTKEGILREDGRSATITGATTKKSSGQTYTVKKGDTLAHIAKCLLGDSSRWRDIYDRNRETIKDPNKIYVGQVIILPDEASGTVSQRTHQSTKSSTRKKTTSTSKKTTSNKTTAASPSKTIPKIESNAGKNSSYMSAQMIFDQYKRKR